MRWPVVAAISLVACARPATTTRRDVVPLALPGGGAVGAEVAVLQIVEDARRELMGTATSALAVGTRCGLAPAPPRGWFAVRYLVAAGRSDLLRLAQRDAPSSEGRLWAAHGLVEAGEFDRASVAEFARTLQGAVWSCDGCTTRESTAEEALGCLYPVD